MKYEIRFHVMMATAHKAPLALFLETIQATTSSRFLLLGLFFVGTDLANGPFCDTKRV
jgi:hypothetical protein